MSAAEDGYLLANNRKAIPDQLEAGIRNLLIDAHWGLSKEGRGTIVTDLEAEGGTGKARQAAIEATGEDFVETAERLIQRQALGEVGGGKQRRLLLPRLLRARRDPRRTAARGHHRLPRDPPGRGRSRS